MMGDQLAGVLTSMPTVWKQGNRRQCDFNAPVTSPPPCESADGFPRHLLCPCQTPDTCIVGAEELLEFSAMDLKAKVNSDVCDRPGPP